MARLAGRAGSTVGRMLLGAGVALLVVAVPAAAVTIVGSPGADTIRGTKRADRLYGGPGDDVLLGFGGDDMLNGGAGKDRLDGGPGDDRIGARDGQADVVLCGAGADVAFVDAVDVVRDCERVVVATPPPPPPVPLENEKPGTPGWAAGFERLAPAGAIEGYAVPTAAPGDSIAFHVSAEPTASYRILVFRIGWYGGVGARLVACLPSCDGSAPAEPRGTPRPTPQGLVHAGWPESQRWPIPADAVSGYYLARFVLTSGPYSGTESWTWLIVREPPGRKAPILVQAPPTNWEAHNGWGGGSVYEYNSPGGRRAQKVAFDRPYELRSQRGTLAWDVPLVRFLERRGYDVGYQGDIDTARDESTLDGRRLVIAAGHNEYWAKEVRDAFEAAKARGTNLAFFAANGGYWQIRYEDDYRTIVSYKSSAADPEPDPQLKTDLFRALVPPRYECALMGIQHQGGLLNWTTDGDYTVTAAAATNPWLKAAGFTPGDVVKGIVSREVDTIPSNQTPESSCGNRLTVLFHRELGGDTLGNADAVTYTAPSGAKVFASGSHQFSWGLEAYPEEREVPRGLVDARLQRFVEAMLDDMSRGSRTR